MQKTGRNDPCPCGSGKKYKQCCMDKQDNVIPFPHRPGTEDTFKHYEQLMEKWDPANGPAPTFMESLGQPNLATGALRDIQQEAGIRQFKSKKELQDFMNERMEAMNNAPNEEFLGLSPSQMQSITHRTFEDNSAIVSLNEKVPPELFNGVPALDQLHYLLNAFSGEEKGIKATARGNFPRKLVQDFWDKFLKEQDILKQPPMIEEDVRQLLELRFFLTDSGLVKKQKGRFILTRKGRQMAENGTPHEKYTMLFLYFTGTMNWLYSTRYPDPFEFIQQSSIFCLYILKQKAEGFTYGKDLASVYKKAFPVLAEDVGSITGYDIVTSGFCFIFLEKFAWYLGLAEMKGDERTFHSSEFQYRTTELFKELFIWGV